MDALQGISKPFRKIAMAVDYTDTDRIVMQYAMHLGNADTEYLLIHIVESAQARMMQDSANDFETLQDKAYLDKYIQLFADKSLKAQGILGFKNRKEEIARIVKENNCDLLVLGSHGHKSIKDFIFGETINTLRHKVDIPVFIAQ
jgi:manganese transport protein